MIRAEKEAEFAAQREDKLRHDLYNYADIKAKAALLEQQVRDYKSFTEVIREVSTASVQQSNLELPQSTATLVAPSGALTVDLDDNWVWTKQNTVSKTGNNYNSPIQSTVNQRQNLTAHTVTVSATGTHISPSISDLSLPHHYGYQVVPTQTAVTTSQPLTSSTCNLVPITTTTLFSTGSENILDNSLSGHGGHTQPLVVPLIPPVARQTSTLLAVDQQQNSPDSRVIQQQSAGTVQFSQSSAINTSGQSLIQPTASQEITGATVINVPKGNQSHQSNLTAEPQQVTNIQQSLPTIAVNTPQPVRPYKGTTSWSSFKDHFTRIATVNGWATDEIKAQHLMISLEGPAAEIRNQSYPLSGYLAAPFKKIRGSERTKRINEKVRTTPSTR